MRTFAEKRGIPRWFVDYREMYQQAEIQLVVLGLPNYLHCDAVVAAAEAGKHVVLEKPMAMNLAECDRMIEACRRANVKLMYAEELCFAPKYARLKQLVDSGALGKPHLVKQMEKHSGPHTPGFTTRISAAAAWPWTWAAMRWNSFAGCYRAPIVQTGRATSVYAQMATHVHGDKTRADDESLIIVEFENGCLGLAEESWAKLGGMDDRAEVYGSAGHAYADLLRGNSIHTYSEQGYDYAVEKASQTSGWSFTIYEENWNYGFPQEMAHFVACVRDDRRPIVTGEDGRATLEIIMAAYASAGSGKKIAIPFKTDAKKPIDLWRP